MTTKTPTPCEHRTIQFNASAILLTESIEDETIVGYEARIRARCHDCHVLFKWNGVALVPAPHHPVNKPTCDRSGNAHVTLWRSLAPTWYNLGT